MCARASRWIFSHEIRERDGRPRLRAENAATARRPQVEPQLTTLNFGERVVDEKLPATAQIFTSSFSKTRASEDDGLSTRRFVRADVSRFVCENACIFSDT